MSVPKTELFFFKTRRGWLITLSLVLVFIGVVGVDQVSKTQVQNTLLLYENKDDIRQFREKTIYLGSLGESIKESGYMGFRFKYSRNTGAAFSMFADWPDWFRVPFFYTVTILALVLIGVFMKSNPIDHHCTRVGLVMIAGGAVGNFIDRFIYGYVIDFIDVDWNFFGWQHDFAIFNVADMAINGGVILLLIDFFLHRKSYQEQKAG